jgi:hypothetical protein
MQIAEPLGPDPRPALNSRIASIKLNGDSPATDVDRRRRPAAGNAVRSSTFVQALERVRRFAGRRISVNGRNLSSGCNQLQ